MKRQLSGLTATAVILAGALLFANCKKGDLYSPQSVVEKNTTISHVLFTSCKNHRNTMQKGFHEPDSVVVFTVNRTTYVWHYNLEVNCGFDSIAVTGQFSGDTIIVTERDIPNNTANCECDVNNSFRINNIPKGGCYLIIYDSRDRKVYEGIIHNQ